MTDPKFKWKTIGQHAEMKIDDLTFQVEYSNGIYFCYIRRRHSYRMMRRSFYEAGAALRFCEDEYNRVTSEDAERSAKYTQGIQNLTEAVKGSQYKEL